MVSLQGGVGTVQHGYITVWDRGRDCSAWSNYRVGTVQHCLFTG